MNIDIAKQFKLQLAKLGLLYLNTTAANFTEEDFVFADEG